MQFRSRIFLFVLAAVQVLALALALPVDHASQLVRRGNCLKCGSHMLTDQPPSPIHAAHGPASESVSDGSQPHSPHQPARSAYLTRQSSGGESFGSDRSSRSSTASTPSMHHDKDWRGDHPFSPYTEQRVGKPDHSPRYDIASPPANGKPSRVRYRQIPPGAQSASAPNSPLYRAAGRSQDHRPGRANGSGPSSPSHDISSGPSSPDRSGPSSPQHRYTSAGAGLRSRYTFSQSRAADKGKAPATASSSGHRRWPSTSSSASSSP